VFCSLCLPRGEDSDEKFIGTHMINDVCAFAACSRFPLFLFTHNHTYTDIHTQTHTHICWPFNETLCPINRLNSLKILVMWAHVVSDSKRKHISPAWVNKITGSVQFVFYKVQTIRKNIERLISLYYWKCTWLLL